MASRSGRASVDIKGDGYHYRSGGSDGSFYFHNTAPMHNVAIGHGSSVGGAPFSSSPLTPPTTSKDTPTLPPAAFAIDAAPAPDPAPPPLVVLPPVIAMPAPPGSFTWGFHSTQSLRNVVIGHGSTLVVPAGGHAADVTLIGDGNTAVGPDGVKRSTAPPGGPQFDSFTPAVPEANAASSAAVASARRIIHDPREPRPVHRKPK